MIIQSYARNNGMNDIAFTVNKDDKDKAIVLCNQIREELKTGEILIDEQIAKVSIVGAGMVDRPGIAAAMFRSLADVGINIKMISTSEIKISCLVDKGNEKLAIKTLCKEFHLDSEEEAVVNGDLPPEKF